MGRMELQLAMQSDAPEPLKRLTIGLRDALAGPEGVQPGGLCVAASVLLGCALAREGIVASTISTEYAPDPARERSIGHAYVRAGRWSADPTREQFAHMANCGDPQEHTCLVFSGDDEHYRPGTQTLQWDLHPWDFDVVLLLRDEEHADDDIEAWLQALGMGDLAAAVLHPGPLPARSCVCCLKPATGRVAWGRQTGITLQQLPLCAAHTQQLRRASPGGSRAPAGRNDPCPCGSGRKYKKCCGT